MAAVHPRVRFFHEINLNHAVNRGNIASSRHRKTPTEHAREGEICEASPGQRSASSEIADRGTLLFMAHKKVAQRKRLPAIESTQQTMKPHLAAPRLSPINLISNNVWFYLCTHFCTFRPGPWRGRVDWKVWIERNFEDFEVLPGIGAFVAIIKH